MKRPKFLLNTQIYDIPYPLIVFTGNVYIGPHFRASVLLSGRIRETPFPRIRRPRYASQTFSQAVTFSAIRICLASLSDPRSTSTRNPAFLNLARTCFTQMSPKTNPRAYRQNNKPINAQDERWTPGKQGQDVWRSPLLVRITSRMPR